MPVFKYSALNEHNEITKGSIDARSADEVYEALAAEGQKVINMREEIFARSKAGKQISKSISSSEIAAFCKQLNIITKSGISIIKGLIMVKEQTDSKKVQELADNLSKSIQKGCCLSEAFKNSGFRLPLLLVNMVQVGEVSGNLDEIFRKMADYYENDTRTRKKMISALIYPCILVCVAVGVIIIFTFFVLPGLVDVIQENGTELPLVTRILMGSSRFVADNLVAVILSIIAVIVLYKKAVPYEVKRKLKTAIIFKTPVVSRVAVDFITARVTRTMGILMNTGLPMLTIMDTLEKVVGNERVAKGISEAKDRINKGESLSASFEQIGFFDSMVTNIISISEETGTLAESMVDIADYYDERFDTGISKAIAMLEPMFTLIMGAVVATILLSVMLPMFNMIGSLSANS
ncbi:MAG: type II secretion system F family protein [Deltaproteobacteria bacterium]